jgi:hypothetical protein
MESSLRATAVERINAYVLSERHQNRDDGESDFFIGCFNYVSSCLFIERDADKISFSLFFSGARIIPNRNRAPLKNKKVILGGRVVL